MIRYYLSDLFWLIGFLAGNFVFYYTNAIFEQFFVYNFMSLMTMLAVGLNNYTIEKQREVRRK